MGLCPVNVPIVQTWEILNGHSTTRPLIFPQGRIPIKVAIWAPPSRTNAHHSSCKAVELTWQIGKLQNEWLSRNGECQKSDKVPLWPGPFTPASTAFPEACMWPESQILTNGGKSTLIHEILSFSLPQFCSRTRGTPG
jgi:hypothetical protein